MRTKKNVRIKAAVSNARLKVNMMGRDEVATQALKSRVEMLLRKRFGFAGRRCNGLLGPKSGERLDWTGLEGEKLNQVRLS